MINMLFFYVFFFFFSLLCHSCFPINVTHKINKLLLICLFLDRQNLDLNKELNDKVAEGRTLGNIGNVNYLLQDYSTSIEYLEKVGGIFKINRLYLFICLSAFGNCKRI